jgi:predicted DNA-binding transcriptional regulator YafY
MSAMLSQIAMVYMEYRIIYAIMSPAIICMMQEKQMSKKDQKRDRTARLLRLQILLWQHPSGLDMEEMARKCLISKRTAYRDLKALEAELNARNLANYVIGYCREREAIGTFIIDRILGEVKIEAETFEIPEGFNIDRYLGSAWGAFADQNVEVIKLRFSKRIGQAVRETSFHPSQVTEMQRDGSLLMTLKVNNTGDFHAWIMSWGKDVEVLEPESLRNQMRDVVRSLADTYNIKEISIRDK